VTKAIGLEVDSIMYGKVNLFAHVRVAKKREQEVMN
jgi:hypothetical protein